MAYAPLPPAAGSETPSDRCPCGAPATQAVTLVVADGVRSVTLCLQHAADLILAADPALTLAVQPCGA